MLGKLAEIEHRFQDILDKMADPAIVSDRTRYRELAEEHRHLTPLVEAIGAYRAAEEQLAGNRGLLADDDPDIQMMAREEIAGLEEQLEELELRIKVLLLPKDPNDEKSVILEVRAGTGGGEAALFAAEVLRMYVRYAESHRWKVEILSANETEIGGIKEAICAIEGQGVYSRLKYESGVHRVQRVPVTEAQGRIHTSACTVAVLPEADEVEVELDPLEIRVDTYRSSGPGGQSVNTTDSAIRVTHLPTGLVVTCQDEKSQHKNKAKALKILRARLLDRAEAEAHAERSAERRSQVGTGDRSERIRTYNFPQNRLTDHRVGLTLYKLEQVVMGDLDMVIDPVISYFQAEALRAGGG